MNSGPEIVLESTIRESDGTEIDTTVHRHWGCQLLRKDGSVFTTRWDPGYGSGTYVPYSEAEARADVKREAPLSRLVTRTETTVVTTTPWVESE